MTSRDRALQWTRAQDGRALCFAEYGDPGGRPVFLMHGTPGCRLLTSKQRTLGYDELLAEVGVRQVRYDRPGFGRSDRQPGRRLLDTPSDVAVIADALRIERFAVVGGSGGTDHSLATAAALPDRVTRVAVTAPEAPYSVIGRDAFTAGMGPRQWRTSTRSAKARRR